jgi:predicted AlkP superfamily pyrophosphatase or phosphodiesterase
VPGLPAVGHRGAQALLWIERVLREYVLETMHPQVIVDWMGRSDSAQHSYGVGSPEALAALRLIDGQIGLLLQRLRQMNLEDKTDIIVTCDHGFDYEPRADLLTPLRESGFANDVVTDNEGGSTLLYVKNHDAERISRLVAKFQASATTNAIFVPAMRPADGGFRCSPSA